MEEKISKKNYFVFTSFSCLVILANYFFWHNGSIGLALGLLYTLFYSYIFGAIFVSKKGWQFIFGFIFMLSIISLVGAGSIFLYQFNDFVFAFLILLFPILLAKPYYNSEIKEKLSLKKNIKQYLDNWRNRLEPKTNSFLVIIYLILTSGAFYFLTLSQTTKSIQSPWQVLPNNFLVIYFFASLSLLLFIFNSNRTKLPLLLISIHTFLSASVALIVYSIGYGFDPFIHQAAEKIINQSGTITPKTPYYLGQYAIVIFFHKLTSINLELIDKILAPALFAITLPSTIYYVFSHWVEKKYALVVSLLALTIPYSGFIMTTPQNLANLFFILTVLISLLYFRGRIHVAVLYILALGTLAIHPLAGIPLIITIFIFNIYKLLYKSYQQYINLFLLTSLVFIIFLPLAFIANGSKITNQLSSLSRSDLQWLGWINNYDVSLNLVYLLVINKIAIAIFIVLIGLAFIAKHKLLKNNMAYLMAAFVLFIDYLIARFVLTFPALRNFDADSFVNRLLILSFYVLIPFFLLGLYVITKKFWDKDKFSQGFIIIVLAGILTGSFYLSYPRLNKFEPAKFYSLSESDLKASYHIEQTAHPNHIVLANQMVGVGSIKQFGFKKYIDGQFYYSMPNGESTTFYDAYLDMVYNGATRETMNVIMNEAGVKESYFVLNKYWRDFEKIAAKAYSSADFVTHIDDGEILIFKYELNQ